MRTNLIALTLLLLFGCAEKEKTNKEQGKSPYKQTITPPIFNPDSAYSFIQKQVDFGPRVPNSKAHKACGVYLETKLMSYGMDVTTQTGQVRAYNGTKLNFKNIIASRNPLENQRSWKSSTNSGATDRRRRPGSRRPRQAPRWPPRSRWPARAGPGGPCGRIS